MIKHSWCVVVICFGCGDEASPVMPDAPPAIDAAVDSAPACGNAGSVTVLGPAFDPDRVQLTMSLVSHDANGAMCGTRDGGSGSEAMMTIDVPPGGMVTMVVDDGDEYHGLFTWTEVQPGDELLFPSLHPRGVTVKMVDVEVTIPPVTGVTSFEVYVQCEHGGGGLSDPAPAGVFTKTVECPSNATALATMVAADKSTTTEYAVSAVTPIAAIGPTTLTLGPWMPAASPTVTVHGTAGYDLAFAGYVPGATPDFHSVSMLASASVTSDPVTVGPRDIPPTWHNHMIVGIAQSAEPMHVLQISRPQTTPMPLVVSTTTDFLPLVSGQLTTPLPRPSITWSTAQPATADAVYINAGNWALVTRAEPGTVRFPEVPAALLPTEPATVKAISIIDASTVAGFEELRRDPLRAYTDREMAASSLGEMLDAILP